MNNTKLLNTSQGNILVSAILGLALSTILFTYKCKTNCNIYKSKEIIIGSIYEFDKKCYKIIKKK